jgi:formylmethanofuran dehydrogenase subunit B
MPVPDPSFESAVDAAAGVLAASRFPLIGGLETDVAGAVAALQLADRLGGAVDHAASGPLLRDVSVLRSVGLMSVNTGEARHRADTYLIVGDGPLAAWPELPDVLFAEGGTHLSGVTPVRRVLMLSARPLGRGTPHGHAWSEHRLAELPLALAALRARVNGRPVAAGIDLTKLDSQAELLKAARYGVAIWSPDEIDALGIEMLAGLIKELNAETRWSGISVSGDASAHGASVACGWMTGFPLRTAFGRGFPEQDSWQFEARRLVESGEADAAVWISTFGAPRPDWLTVPTVLISDMAGPERRDGATFVVGRPAVDHDAVLFDRRTGTLVAHAARTPRNLPTAADALRAIAARLSA